MPYIHYTIQGSKGPTLVFLHGFCDNQELWSEFVAPFLETYQVLTLDLPGFGNSEMLPVPFTLDQIGDELAEWLTEKKLEKSLIVGHSLGGYVALSLLARHPEMISGIVLFHSTPLPDLPERKAIRNKVIDFVNQHGVEPYIETFVPGLFADKLDPHVRTTRERTLATRPAALVGYAAAMRDRPDQSATVIAGHLPVLIIGGIRDSLISIDQLREIAKNAPKCELFELEKAAHMGIFEAKTECQAIISGFAARTFKDSHY